MYLMNTTKSVIQAMFINCDHSMLTYTFYRISKNILRLFQIRLKEMIKIILLPTILLGIGYYLILIMISQINQFLHDFVAFISLISISIFFSIHYLVLYYLLQPYNANTQIKSLLYLIVTSLTYFICYLFTRIQVPILSFGILCIFFSVVYCVIACYLVYKKAKETFKIRS